MLRKKAAIVAGSRRDCTARQGLKTILIVSSDVFLLSRGGAPGEDSAKDCKQKKQGRHPDNLS